MHRHPLARLTPINRERLIRRYLAEGLPLNILATQAGISLRSAYKWLARCQQAVGRLWRIDRVFAAPRDGRSIRINYSRPSPTGTSAARFATSQGTSPHPLPPLAGS
jgi:hypothetical protein